VSTLLSLRNLSVQFDTVRGRLNAVKEISLDIESGESVGIVGESGSGKSVLSRAAMGILHGGNVHKSGDITFDGNLLSDLSAKELREFWGTGMAMIFQDPMTSLNPVRKIGTQIGEALRIRLGMSKDDANKKSVELLRLVRVPDPEATLSKFPFQLSGGMRQRVMIAIALACDPKLLFADEPTTALDVTVQAQILELLDDLRTSLNMSMVLVTHDLGVVAGHTDRVVVMYAGEVVESAKTTDLFANMRMPYTEALFKSIPTLDTPTGTRLPTIEGRVPDPTQENPGCSFASRCTYVQEKCRTEHPPLTSDGNDHHYRCWFPIQVRSTL
jgi:ABC-type dipeptide/oligopeptide/nickel transport system ATPase component